MSFMQLLWRWYIDWIFKLEILGGDYKLENHTEILKDFRFSSRGKSTKLVFRATSFDFGLKPFFFVMKICNAKFHQFVYEWIQIFVFSHILFFVGVSQQFLLIYLWVLEDICIRNLSRGDQLYEENEIFSYHSVSVWSFFCDTKIVNKVMRMSPCLFGKLN